MASSGWTGRVSSSTTGPNGRTVSIRSRFWRNCSDTKGFTVRTELNRKDYGISWNRALDQGGVVLGDDVEISITLAAVKQEKE